METLRIDDGAVRLAVNGDEDRVITFYPTDVHFAEAFFDLVQAFTDKKAEFDRKTYETAEEELADLREVYTFMRREIDKVFGAGTCQTAFGDHDCLTAYIQLFNGVRPYIANARKKELERYLGDTNSGVMEA